ncbi:MAG: hypothetical protein H6873_02350 [Hyphomicrobiaceae bacterium]|nr:hypothetical protein [Hyphomicrobiaceae bacterium]
MILPDKEMVLAAGDEFEVGGKTYRLDAIKPKPNGLFTIRVAGPAERRADVDDAAMPPRIELSSAATALQFRTVLSEISTDVLAGLAGGAPPPIIGWIKSQSSSVSKDWTGEEWGPSHDHRWVAQFADDDVRRFGALEVSLGLEDIRYSPNEEWRYEVSGYWRVGERSAHAGARQDVPDLITWFFGDADEPFVNDLVVKAAQGIAALTGPVVFDSGLVVEDLAAILELRSGQVLAHLIREGETPPEVLSFHDQTALGGEWERAALFAARDIERLGKLEARVWTLKRPQDERIPERVELNGWWRVGERRLRLVAITGPDGRIRSVQFLPAAPELRKIIGEAVEALAGKA